VYTSVYDIQRYIPPFLWGLICFLTRVVVDERARSSARSFTDANPTRATIAPRASARDRARSVV